MKNVLYLFVIAMLLQTPKATAIPDRIADLQRKIDAGTLKLEFEADHGYLKSLLKILNIPVSSQALVFSKSSFQLHLISPDRPRALYFNDDVYAGWTRGGEDIEIIGPPALRARMAAMLASMSARHA